MAERRIEQGAVGGVRLAAEEVEGAELIALSCNIDCGSVDDPAGRSGMTHLIEHLLFQGGRRSYEELVALRDELGGYLNAATSGFDTELTVMIVPEDLERTVAMLADMVLGSDLRNFETTRGVILAEILEDEDDYTDQAVILAEQTLHGDHPYSRPTGGVPTELQAIDPDEAAAYYRVRYTTPNLALVAVGAVDLGRLARAAGDFASTPAGAAPIRPPFADARPTTAFLERPSGVYNVVLAGSAPALSADMAGPRLAEGLLTDQRSARLFRRLRDEGLAYDVSSLIARFPFGGEVNVSFTVSEELLPRALAACLEELERTDDWSDQEVRDTARRLQTARRLSGQNLSGEATTLSHQLLYGHPLRTLDQRAAELATTSPDAVRAWARLFAPARLTFAAVGPDRKAWERALATLDQGLPALAAPVAVD